MVEREFAPLKKLSQKYFKNIIDFIVSNDTVDFWMLQEVDVKAKRSYHINEVEKVTDAKAGSHGVFAKNYMVQFVPVPVSEPMGVC